MLQIIFSFVWRCHAEKLSTPEALLLTRESWAATLMEILPDNPSILPKRFRKAVIVFAQSFAQSSAIMREFLHWDQEMTSNSPVSSSSISPLSSDARMSRASITSISTDSICFFIASNLAWHENTHTDPEHISSLFCREILRPSAHTGNLEPKRHIKTHTHSRHTETNTCSLSLTHTTSFTLMFNIRRHNLYTAHALLQELHCLCIGRKYLFQAWGDFLTENHQVTTLFLFRRVCVVPVDPSCLSLASVSPRSRTPAAARQIHPCCAHRRALMRVLWSKTRI